MVTRRSTRQSSNVFHTLTKDQITRLREAFKLLDADADSKLSVSDISSFLDSIGSPFTDGEIEKMLEDLEPTANFMMLLTCIGEKLSDISSENELLAALRLFDDEGDGHVESGLLRHWMTERGDRLAEADYNYLVRGCEEGGKISCRKLASKIKYGEILDKTVRE